MKRRLERKCKGGRGTRRAHTSPAYNTGQDIPHSCTSQAQLVGATPDRSRWCRGGRTPNARQSALYRNEGPSYVMGCAGKPNVFTGMCVQWRLWRLIWLPPVMGCVGTHRSSLQYPRPLASCCGHAWASALACEHPSLFASFRSGPVTRCPALRTSTTSARQTEVLGLGSGHWVARVMGPRASSFGTFLRGASWCPPQFSFPGLRRWV